VIEQNIESGDEMICLLSYFMLKVPLKTDWPNRLQFCWTM